jgi:diguanylate cyclase (GGDEF)-like protein
MVAADGRIVWLRDLVNSVQGPDGVWRLRGVMFVITETKELEERLRHGASHDSLTGLPNRESLLARLREVHSRSIRKPSYALLFLDVDRFKIVNDTLGHHHGDKLLIELARRLAAFAADRGTVARLGGDEFAVLIEQVQDAVDARSIAERLQEVVSQPFEIGGRRLEPSASIGIVLGRRECNDLKDLLQDADTAMYRAKAAQRGSVQLFDLNMRRELLNRVKLEADLKRGFRAGEFRVFFQPIVDLPSGRPEGFEALTRWIHPERGIVAASEFMEVALESEMGADLAWNAVELTFRQASSWERRFLGAFRLSSNLSEKQFAQSDFLQRMERLLVAAGADPRNLVLEITEDVAAEDLVTEQKLCELKRMGFELALDDFGVGRSSLNRLCRLPIDLIKIDRTFIQSLEHGESEVLIRAITAVADDLGMEVVAEGIETDAQCARLVELGFRLGQGYLFDHALPLDEAERRLAERPSNLVSQWMGSAL